jgi:hypothetical protein
MPSFPEVLIVLAVEKAENAKTSAKAKKTA